MTDTNEIERLTLGAIVADVRVRMRGITGIGAPTASEVEGAMTDLVYAGRVERYPLVGGEYLRLTDAEIKRRFDLLCLE